MKIRYRFLLLVVFTPLLSLSQPSGYYNNAFGRTGESLRAALYDIIKGHNQLSYTPDLWNAFYTTDVKPGTNKLYTIYSDRPGSTPPYEYTVGTDQCGSANQNNENFCYNREHVWPQSKFGGSVYPMYSDLWIVYPTDYYVNSQRGNFPYGIVSAPTKTFLNGSRLGPNAYSAAPPSTAFEPIDSFKGDLARSYFYISTRYYADSAQFIDWEMATKSTLRPWAVQMLLNWHRMDPVSAKEKSRNDAVHTLQGNRNPFIDEPRFADCIWAGNCIGLSIKSVPALTSQVSPNPASISVNINLEAYAPDEVLTLDIFNLNGQAIYRLSRPSPTVRIIVADWPKGLYIVRLQTRESIRVEKLSIE